MTISQAETIIGAIETSEKWQEEFEIKLDSIECINSFDKMHFAKMRDIIQNYKRELCRKANTAKNNTEI